MSRPLLGIIACNRTMGGDDVQSVGTRYMRAAMEYADVPALIIPSLPDLMEVSEVIGGLDGLLLTGSPSNVEGHRYGDELGCGPHDPARDETALRLIESFAALGRPIFGICRGFQEINVALGGTLRRDTSEHPELLRHHSPGNRDFDEMFGHTHRVRLAEGGLLHREYGKDELDVISVHYQGVARLAGGLTVEATAPDGLVEAFSTRLDKALVVAVQWHPEWKPDQYPDSQRFFAMLGKAMRGAL